MTLNKMLLCRVPFKLSVTYAECYYAECHYAEYHYAECHYAECRYAECRYAPFTLFHFQILFEFHNFNLKF
jgi:hypothetical protein